jgi:uncharacterized protein (DUF1684 family)
VSSCTHIFIYFMDQLSGRIYAMNGKSVEVDNTDAEGRLVLAGMCHGYSMLF